MDFAMHISEKTRAYLKTGKTRQQRLFPPRTSLEFSKIPGVSS